MRVHVADHPLVAHKITLLRDERTNSATFRALAEELVILIGYEATKQLKTETVEVTTPVTKTTGQRLSEPLPLVVPILRAGLGLLEGMLRLLPSAEVGFLGMVRNEETLEPTVYSERLPKDITGRQAIILTQAAKTTIMLTSEITRRKIPTAVVMVNPSMADASEGEGRDDRCRIAR